LDWTVVGAIGEILGAAGVIFSLLYLGRQIRSASIQERRSRYEAALDMSVAWSQSLSTDADLAGVTLRGMLQGPDSLDPDERLRFYAGLLTPFRAYERVAHYWAEGAVDDWGKDIFDRVFRDLLSLPGIRQYWADRRHWFSPLAQTSIDALVAEATGDGMLGSYPAPEGDG